MFRRRDWRRESACKAGRLIKIIRHHKSAEAERFARERLHHAWKPFAAARFRAP